MWFNIILNLNILKMKRILGLLVLLTGVLFSCSDDDDSLDYGKEMYITNMKMYTNTTVKNQGPQQPMFDVTFNFNDLGLITAVELGQNGGEADVTELTGENTPEKFVQKLLSEMIQDEDAIEKDGEKIIKGYEFFTIKTRDGNGNVTEFTMGEGENLQTVKIEYSSKPFFLYWNLKAAGVMNALNNIKYFGTANDTKAEMVEALLPVNNIKKVTYTESDGESSEFELTYVYDASDMLTQIKVEGKESYLDEDETKTDEMSYTINVTCKE